PTWERFAERHGYDIVCVDTPADRPRRAERHTRDWPVCRVLAQDFTRGYDRIVWLDPGMLLNPEAPSMVDGTPIDKIGAVDECATPTPELYERSRQVIERHSRAAGAPSPSGGAGCRDHAVQPGMLVLSPHRHRSLLERIHDRHSERRDPAEVAGRAISSGLLEAGLVHWLDPRFNYAWPTYKSLQFPFLLDDPGHPRLSECIARALTAVYGLRFSDGSPELGRFDAAAVPPRGSDA